jgi:hypothetical protein
VQQQQIWRPCNAACGRQCTLRAVCSQLIHHGCATEQHHNHRLHIRAGEHTEVVLFQRFVATSLL